jgi:hypothetical protein
MFAMNIKQQLLNEQGEIQAISELVGLLHEPMQTSFDYVIKSSDPKSIDTESKNWEIPLEVIATANKNIDFCANYCINILTALSLSSEEVTNYKNLNKEIFPVVINYKGGAKTFYLRKKRSIIALNTFKNQWEFYTRLFTIKSGLDESNGNGVGEIYNIKGSLDKDYDYDVENNINFLTKGEQAATFKWNDKRTLEQIEQMTGYIVKPRGIVSHFKNGGYVVYEENGHGLVESLFDLGEMNWESAKVACDELDFNGYSDWYLPSIEELNLIYLNLAKYIVGMDISNYYWSSTLEPHYGRKIKFFSNYIDNIYNGNEDSVSEDSKNNVRAVRAF